MRNKKTLVVIRLALLIIVVLALLLFIATVIAALVLGLVYSASLPVSLKVGLVALLIVAMTAELELYRRWRRRGDTRRQRIEIERELDFSDEMLESLDQPRLTQAQRDVLRGTLESLFSETGKGGK